MKPDRCASRARSVLLAAASLIAAISLIAFGAAPRSSAASAVPAPAAPAAAGKALAHQDVQVVTRSAVSSMVEHQVPLPGVGTTAAVSIFAFAGWLLLKVRRGPLRTASYRPGSAPARAPPPPA